VVSLALDIIMNTARRYDRNPNFSSFLVMIGFLLFAIQPNYQYSSLADPSEDTKDPVSAVARIVHTVRGTAGEHLPVVVEEPAPVAGRSRYHPVAGLPDQPLMASDRALPSLRGPPRV
jgi:hypothetical protein